MFKDNDRTRVTLLGVNANLFVVHLDRMNF